MPIDTLYLVHHSHTDIGFTGDQPVIWELHTRFLHAALDHVEREAERYGVEQSLRWTIESAAVLERWLCSARADEIDRLIAAERAGLIEVTAMLFNLTPLYDPIQYLESLQLVNRLRADYGFTICSAMNCDVNGQNWPLADLLLDAGMTGFSMAINHHFGGPPTPRPGVFHWQAPSGRHLPSLNGWQYSKAGEFGIGDTDEQRFAAWWPQIEQYLIAQGYPLPCLMIQGIHPYGDNAGIYPPLGDFARRWNAAGRTPQIVLATPAQWWRAVAAQAEALPIHRGDWTDYWNFGCISSAREQAIERASRTRLVSADAIYAAQQILPPTPTDWARRGFAQHRARAWDALQLWGEHTWSPDGAGEIWRDDSRSQWTHKAALAYTAHSYSQLLQRDALADLVRHVARTDADDLLIFNPLPWTRTISGPIADLTLNPRGRADDSLAGRHYQDHFAEPTAIGASEQDNHFSLPPTVVPGYGYTVVPRSRVIATGSTATVSEDATITTEHYRVSFDRERGGIGSLYDHRNECEWVDQHAAFTLGTFVHEQVADRAHPIPRRLLNAMDWRTTLETIRGWQPGWRAIRTPAQRLIQHRVYQNPLGWSVEQALEHPVIGTIRQRFFLPMGADYLEYEAYWQMGQETHPEATYVVFPFNLPEAVARIDVGGQAVRLEEDQLPGVNRDYFTVQRWVDLNNMQRGVTIATPINPLVQLGDFHFAHNQAQFTLPHATFLGWITNNYWECNFPYAQPGTVVARYRLTPYHGHFDETCAHRRGREAAQHLPLVQHLGELPHAPMLPSNGTLLALPDGPVQVEQLRAGATPQTLLLRLFNQSDHPQTAQIRSGLLRIAHAQACDIFDQPEAILPVTAGGLEIALAPRRAQVIELTVQVAP
jgi:hypothetical protein